MKNGSIRYNAERITKKNVKQSNELAEIYRSAIQAELRRQKRRRRNDGKKGKN